MERKAVNDMFVILSDIWLDEEEVRENSLLFTALIACLWFK